jgi:hypothetical protein
MGAGAAQVQPVDAEAIPGVAEERPPQEELVEAGLGVQWVTARQSELALEIDGREHLAVGDQLADPRRHRFEDRDDGVPECLTARLAPAALERVRGVLGNDAHDLGARLGARDEGWVGERGNGRLQDRSLAPVAVLGRVEGALHRVDRRRDHDATAEEALVAARGREHRQLSQREVDLGHDAGRPDVAGSPAQRRTHGHGVD